MSTTNTAIHVSYQTKVQEINVGSKLGLVRQKLYFTHCICWLWLHFLIQVTTLEIHGQKEPRRTPTVATDSNIQNTAEEKHVSMVLQKTQQSYLTRNSDINIVCLAKTSNVTTETEATYTLWT